MEYIPIRVSDIVRNVNRDWYLPAIQRELVWNTDSIERLFDSLMADFPIGSFLFWKLEQRNKDQWPIYEFVRQFDQEMPHNKLANLDGIQKDITLVLDGQQRITSFYLGLRGSYRYFRYRWRKTTLYLNLLKKPILRDENPEEMLYEFSFRENATHDSQTPALWYRVGRILDFDDAEDAKSDMKQTLLGLSDIDQENANRLIGRLHTRIHTITIGNYYEEKSQDYDKVLQIFVRANSAGQQLEYSDLLLSTATAKWEKLDARTEIHEFTDSLNEIGFGFRFGKDFVLKACLYLCDDLPVQYRVKNFTKTNLQTIEANWESIKDALECTVRLISRFGFHAKNVVAPLALLPIAFWLMRRRSNDHKFDTSSSERDAKNQLAIRRWFIFSTLKGSFGGSSDTTLTRLREIQKQNYPQQDFPADKLYESLEIAPSLNDLEIERIVGFKYQGRYTNLALSLLYPDFDWKSAVFHEDHIYPKSEFTPSNLRKRGYDDAIIREYMDNYNSLSNLQLLTETENMNKNAQSFDEWLSSRDSEYRSRHLIPNLSNYDFDCFLDFVRARRELQIETLKDLS